MKVNDEFDALVKRKIIFLEDNSDANEVVENELWKMVNAKRAQTTRTVSKRMILWVSALAASLSLLVIAHFILTPSDEEVMFSMDSSTTTQIEMGVSEDLVWAEEFIATHCKVVSEVCQNPEFTQLQKELNLIEVEVKDLELMISQYGADEFLIQAKIKIENHKSEITFRLVQMLMS